MSIPALAALVINTIIIILDKKIKFNIYVAIIVLIITIILSLLSLIPLIPYTLGGPIIIPNG